MRKFNQLFFNLNDNANIKNNNIATLENITGYALFNGNEAKARPMTAVPVNCPTLINIVSIP